MPMEPEYHTVVVGGGPAGSTTAALLAMKGLKVLLLERELFPRAHVGESLLPASLPIFDSLGVRDSIDNAGFVKKYGAAMVWGNDRSMCRGCSPKPKDHIPTHIKSRDLSST